MFALLLLNLEYDRMAITNICEVMEQARSVFFSLSLWWILAFFLVSFFGNQRYLLHQVTWPRIDHLCDHTGIDVFPRISRGSGRSFDLIHSVSHCYHHSQGEWRAIGKRFRGFWGPPMFFNAVDGFGLGLHGYCFGTSTTVASKGIVSHSLIGVEIILSFFIQSSWSTALSPEKSKQETPAELDEYFRWSRVKKQPSTGWVFPIQKICAVASLRCQYP